MDYWEELDAKSACGDNLASPFTRLGINFKDPGDRLRMALGG